MRGCGAHGGRRGASGCVETGGRPSRDLGASGRRDEPWCRRTGLRSPNRSSPRRVRWIAVHTSEVQDWGERSARAKVRVGGNECGVASTASSNPTASTESNTSSRSRSRSRSSRRHPRRQPRPASDVGAASRRARPAPRGPPARPHRSRRRNVVRGSRRRRPMRPSPANAASRTRPRRGATQTPSPPKRPSPPKGLPPNVGSGKHRRRRSHRRRHPPPAREGCAASARTGCRTPPPLPPRLTTTTTTDLAGLGEGAICAPFGARRELHLLTRVVPEAPDASVLRDDRAARGGRCRSRAGGHPGRDAARQQ